MSFFQDTGKALVTTACSLAGLALGGYIFKTLFPNDPTERHLTAVESMSRALIAEWDASDAPVEIRKDPKLCKDKIEQNINLAKRNYVMGNLEPLLTRLSLVHDTLEKGRAFRIKANMVVSNLCGLHV